MISSGQSIDTEWDKIRLKLLSLDRWAWLVIFSIFLLLISMALKLLAMKKHLNEDEKEIVLLEEGLKEVVEKEKEESEEIKKIEQEIEQLKKKKN
jgi:hypothetical protein